MFVVQFAIYVCNVGRHKIFSLDYYFNWKMEIFLENDPNLDLEICIVQL